MRMQQEKNASKNAIQYPFNLLDKRDQRHIDFTSKDAEFLRFQQEILQKICAVFGLSPDDLGMVSLPENHGYFQGYNVPKKSFVLRGNNHRNTENI